MQKNACFDVFTERKWLLLILGLLFTLLPVLQASAEQPNSPEIVFACDQDNELFGVVSAALGGRTARYDKPTDAVDSVRAGGLLLILADEYPRQTQRIEDGVLQSAADKNVRVYIEFPADKTAGLSMGTPSVNALKRLVVHPDNGFKRLEDWTLLDPHECHFSPVISKVESDAIRLMLARVAGYNTAVFGYEGANPEPALFHHTDPKSGAKCLIATIGLSHFIQGRYAPTDHWELFWEDLFTELLRDKKPVDLSWKPLTVPAFGPDERISADTRRAAIKLGITWFAESGQLVHEDWLDVYEKNSGSYEPAVIHQPSIPHGSPVGDGSLGILEGTVNPLYPDGSQAIRWHVRGDDVGVAGMAYALYGKLQDNQHSSQIAANLLAYLNNSPLSSGAKSEPKSNVYGLRAWNATTGSQVFYSDDIARLQLGEIGAAAALETDVWDRQLAIQILGMFRLTGTNGFWAQDRYDGDLPGIDWRDLHNATPNPAARVHPHFESYKLACFLWLYDATGYEPLLDRSQAALGAMVTALKDGSMRWTNGIQQERARLVLPLAWLVRVDDKPKHRAWLTYVIDELLKHQHSSGAIPEEIGTANGYYPPPASNSAFGTNEAPIIQTNGDPATDLLYTTNFAFKGLIEAEAVLDDPELTHAVNRLADFLVRVQVRSDRPLLDGQWLRGFDYKKWDYWGSDSDHGWGVWGNQTGWTHAEIISGLALLELKTSLWELSADRRQAEVLSEVLEDMMANASPVELRVSHAAIKRSVELKQDADTRYAAAGPATLTDGIVSGPSHRSRKWLGFEGTDLDATIDLGEVIEINSVGLSCMQEKEVGIYLPLEIKVSVSLDGETFTTVSTIKHDNKQGGAGPERTLLSTSPLKTKARFIRIHAKSVGKIPQGQPSQGAQAWLFVDELLVNAEELEPKQEK